jgi:hypothetical protein
MLVRISVLIIQINGTDVRTFLYFFLRRVIIRSKVDKKVIHHLPDGTVSFKGNYLDILHFAFTDTKDLNWSRTRFEDPNNKSALFQ